MYTSPLSFPSKPLVSGLLGATSCDAASAAVAVVLVLQRTHYSPSVEPWASNGEQNSLTTNKPCSHPPTLGGSSTLPPIWTGWMDSEGGWGTCGRRVDVSVSHEELTTWRLPGRRPRRRWPLQPKRRGQWRRLRCCCCWWRRHTCRSRSRGAMGCCRWQRLATG